VAKTTSRQRQLPITAIKNRIVAKSDDSEEEGEILKKNGLRDILRRLQEMERSIQERDQTIARQGEEIRSQKARRQNGQAPRSYLRKRGWMGQSPQGRRRDRERV
jgi:hypothetical protein